MVSRKSRTWTAVILTAAAGCILTFSGRVSASPDQGAAKVIEDEIATGKAMGSKNAPIRFEDFSDFQCPACRNFYMTVTRQLIDDYVVTGKVYWVHHDFPIHNHAAEAAKWADAAAAIGKFQEVENALYTNQDSWGASGNIEPFVANVLSPAQLKRVEALEGSSEVAAAVQHDEDMGHQRNVTQTPSLFITYKGNVTPVPAAGASFPLLKSYFDYLLKQ
jgi:protein-disulfide isomerase